MSDDLEFSNLDLDLELELWGDGNQNTDNRVSSSGEIYTDTSDVGRFDTSLTFSSKDRITDDLIMPKAKPVKAAAEHPMIVVIDDDFATLDLMKIYLQRSYEYVSFDNAREAIFYLNKNIPDLIFLDCYMSVIRAKRMVEIIRSYPEYREVPIYFLAEKDERGPMEAKIAGEDYANITINGILTKPVARGELQDILDAVFSDGKDGEEQAPDTGETA